MTLNSQLRKIKYSYFDELVAGFCILVVGFLFFHIFHDFINEHIASISLEMKDYFNKFFSILVMIFCAFYSGKKIAAEQNKENSFKSLVIRLGESPKQIKIYWILYISSLLFTFYFPVILILSKYFLKFAVKDLIFSLLVMLCISFVTALLKIMNFTEDSQKPIIYHRLLENFDFDSKTALFKWRWQIFLTRNPKTKMTISCLFLLFFINIAIIVFEFPFSLNILCSFASGLILASILIYQVAFDLSYSWIEKNIGISHKSYLHSITKLCTIWGIILGSVNGGGYFITHLYFINFNTELLSEAIKIIFISMTPSWIIPQIIFQVDPRRPVIQIFIMFIFSLFINTAIFATTVTILLLPLIDYYGKISQKDRFYRA